MSGAMRRIGEYLGLLEDTGRYDDEYADDYESYDSYDDRYADTQHPGASVLSAGMSGDLEEAVRHGATHVRVGSAVLGSRPSVP